MSIYTLTVRYHIDSHADSSAVLYRFTPSRQCGISHAHNSAVLYRFIRSPCSIISNTRSQQCGIVSFHTLSAIMYRFIRSQCSVISIHTLTVQQRRIIVSIHTLTTVQYCIDSYAHSTVIRQFVRSRCRYICTYAD
jgi:hypothetical protein